MGTRGVKSPGLGFKLPRTESELEIHLSLLTVTPFLPWPQETRQLGLAFQALGVSTAAEERGAVAGWDPGFIRKGATAPGRKFGTCNRSKDRDNQGQELPPPLENMPPSLRWHRAWQAFKPHSSYKIHQAEPSAWQPVPQLPSLLLAGFSLLPARGGACPKLGRK